MATFNFYRYVTVKEYVSVEAQDADQALDIIIDNNYEADDSETVETDSWEFAGQEPDNAPQEAVEIQDPQGDEGWNPPEVPRQVLDDLARMMQGMPPAKRVAPQEPPKKKENELFIEL